MPVKAIGYDGNITIGSVNVIEFKSWTATISRVVSDISGFSGRGRHRRLGKWDIQGGFTGVPLPGTTNVIAGGMSQTTPPTCTFIVTGTGTAAISIAAPCVVDSVPIGSTHDGDATISGTLQLSTESTNDPPFTTTWVTS